MAAASTPIVDRLATFNCLALRAAIVGKHFSVAEFLIANGSRLNDRDLLKQFVLQGDVESLQQAECLFRAGTPIDDENVSVLQWAAQEGHVDVVRFLVERGVDVRTACPPIASACKTSDWSDLFTALCVGSGTVLFGFGAGMVMQCNGAPPRSPAYVEM